jgi:hypothetical protein
MTRVEKHDAAKALSDWFDDQNISLPDGVEVMAIVISNIIAACSKSTETFKIGKEGLFELLEDELEAAWEIHEHLKDQG